MIFWELVSKRPCKKKAFMTRKDRKNLFPFSERSNRAETVQADGLNGQILTHFTTAYHSLGFILS